MKSKLLLINCVASLLLVPDPIAVAQPTFSDAKIKNKLQAVARAYGYVRFFHPSDQAALVNWDAMAYHATERTMRSSDLESIPELVTSLFEPMVVDLEIYEGAMKDRPPTREVAADQLIAWQHLGVGLSTASFYRSGRLNRKRIVAKKTGGPFGNLLMGLDPQEFRGQEIRYRFDARMEQGKGRLQGWWRVDRESGQSGLFENMSDRPITRKEWKEYELTGTVDEDAEQLIIGIMFWGTGSGLIDNVRLEKKVDGQWISIEVPNADFEAGRKKPDSWFQTVAGYQLATVKSDFTSGKQAARLGAETTSFPGNPIFDAIPKLGEVVDAEISPGVRIRFPLALPISHQYTSGDDQATDQEIEKINAFETATPSQSIASVANVILLWNVFQHFYPYFDQVDCDWDAALKTALDKAYRLDQRTAATKNLQWLVAQLHDGHGNVYDMKTPRQAAPVAFDWVENQLVVVASNQDDFQVGDIVTEVDGKPAAKVLSEMEAYISGSPQWKRYIATRLFSQGTQARQLLLERGDEQLKLPLEFAGRHQAAVVDKGEVCRIEVDGENDEDDIWYIDMGRAEPKDINPLIRKFARAKGIVLDFRGYPRGTQYLFQHMTDQHMQSQKWQIPKQIYPDRHDMANFQTSGRWQMPPKKPRFAGKMVFITNGSAISYAESCMAIVAEYELGEIIGSPTAGANGNINPFSLPDGYRVVWTGMRVVNHDDSQHHVRGVAVTKPMKPTIDGIRDGRDELLQAAIQSIGEGN